MMINNNPYNLPEKQPPKPNRVYTEHSQLRNEQQQFLDGHGYNQYIVRNQHYGGSKHDENFGYRNQYAARCDGKSLMASPKTQPFQATGLGNLNMSMSMGGAGCRIATTMGASLEKLKQSSVIAQDSQISLPSQSLKQLNQRIEGLTQSIRSNQKRIADLQKQRTSTINFLPNNSKLYGSEESNDSFHRHQNQLTESFLKLKDQVLEIRQELRFDGKGGRQFIKLVAEKCKQITDISKTCDISQQIKKQIQTLQTNLKVTQHTLSTHISNLQQHQHSALYPPYKSSCIKSSTTGTLLHYIQSFKVQKAGRKSLLTSGPSLNKNNQISINIAETMYYVDGQGYLLDQDQYYLLDGRDCRVKLDEQHIRVLRDQGVFF